MKCLTVQQPWAWAIFHGKNIENRTQLWRYRGPLAIHAGNRWSEHGERDPRIRNAFRQVIDPQYNGGRLPRWVFGDTWTSEQHPAVVMGAILGVVDLVDVHYDAGCCRPWGESAYVEHGGRNVRQVVHLVHENERLLPEPIPCRGALGLWTPPADILNQLSSIRPGTCAMPGPYDAHCTLDPLHDWSCHDGGADVSFNTRIDFRHDCNDPACNRQHFTNEGD